MPPLIASTSGTWTHGGSVPISLTAVGVRQILELTLHVRPRIVGGDGNTNITAALLLRRRY